MAQRAIGARTYLPELTVRHKCHTAQRNLLPNDLVLVADEKTPRGRWNLGKVIESISGADGVTRSVKIRTAHESMISPVARLCHLEASE